MTYQELHDQIKEVLKKLSKRAEAGRATSLDVDSALVDIIKIANEYRRGKNEV